MNLVYLRGKITPEEIHELRIEFPNFQFFSSNDLERTPLQLLKANYWDFVEILYDEELSSNELSKAHQLKWIHSPSPHVDKIFLNDASEGRNFLLTNTKEIDTKQIGEFVLSCIFSLSKNLFFWQETKNHTTDVKGWWEKEERRSAWLLEEKTFLQIGLGPSGAAITKKAHDLGLNVWGLGQRRSLHPHCHKNFAPKDLHSILPAYRYCFCLFYFDF